MKSYDLRILVIDDESAVHKSFELIFKAKNMLFFARTGDEALNILKKDDIDLVFLDIDLPGMDGFDVLKAIKKFDSTIEIVMITADTTTKSAVRSIKMGAYDYLTKPFDVDEIELITEHIQKEKATIRELTYLKEEIQKKSQGFNIVGKSRAINNVRKIIQKISHANSTVLITGETGTGKELVARAIHSDSPNSNDPFIAVNCGAIPDLLLESELFGHEKGAFTGAQEKKIGKFEVAGFGTIFLDEISNMPERLQVKLLRVLQEREIERVGGNRLIKVNARIIAATNVDLKEHIRQGKFRDDLFHRLNVICIQVPSLIERKEDIPLLVHYFLGLFSKKFNVQVCNITPKAMKALCNYTWPGNIRELSNLIERMVLLGDDTTIREQHIPYEVLIPHDNRINNVTKGSPLSFKEERSRFEREMIINILCAVNYNQSKASKVLNIHRNTLLAKLQQYNIDIHELKKEKKAKTNIKKNNKFTART